MSVPQTVLSNAFLVNLVSTVVAGMTPNRQAHTYTHTHTHTHTPLDHWTPIAGGDDSDATAEAIAACAWIASFNSLQG